MILAVPISIVQGLPDFSYPLFILRLRTSHDTAEFAAQSIRSWWYGIGRHAFPDATKLHITADGGGGNGSCNRLWKLGLAELAQETGLTIEASHFPPGILIRSIVALR